MMESFRATLKAECFAERPLTKHAARLKIFDSIEGFYNRHRLHSSLNDQSALAFERSFGYNNNQPRQKRRESTPRFRRKIIPRDYERLPKTLAALHWLG